jgi:hypothetical protein
MRLPNGYRRPELTYAVELHDPEGKSLGQVGAFFSMEGAEACRAQLESEGRTDLVINQIPVHTRLEDWQSIADAGDTCPHGRHPLLPRSARSCRCEDTRR